MILEKLKAMIGDILPMVNPDTVTESTRLVEDMGLNSMTLMLFALAIENEFDVEFADAPNFRTVADVIAFIEANV